MIRSWQFSLHFLFALFLQQLLASSLTLLDLSGNKICWENISMKSVESKGGEVWRLTFQYYKNDNYQIKQHQGSLLIVVININHTAWSCIFPDAVYWTPHKKMKKLRYQDTKILPSSKSKWIRYQGNWRKHNYHTPFNWTGSISAIL